MNRRKRAPGLWVRPFAQVRKIRGARDEDRFHRAPDNLTAQGAGQGEAGCATQDDRTDRVRPVILYRWAQGTRAWMAADMLDQVWKIEWMTAVPGIRGEASGRFHWKAEVEVQRATRRLGGEVRVEGILRVTGVGPDPGSPPSESGPLHYERRDVPFSLILGEGWFSNDPRTGPAAGGWEVEAASPGGQEGPAGLSVADEPGQVTTSDWRAQVLVPSRTGHHPGEPASLWIRVTGKVVLWVRVIRLMPES